MTGLDKAKKIAEKLKAETQEKQIETAAQDKKPALDEDAFKKMMAADAQADFQAAGSALPFLRVYVANKSTATLADGSDPTNGWFFYTPTKEQYETIHCHILHISRGFRMAGMPDENGVVKNKWTHIVAGVILNDEPKPFWLFITGQERVKRLWAFQKVLKDINGLGTPTFALIVTLSTEKVKLEKGQAMAINYAIDRDAAGNPVRISSAEEYIQYRNKANEQKRFVAEYIDRKEVDVPEPVGEIDVSQPAALPEVPPEARSLPF